jgi:hypothetical protein
LSDRLRVCSDEKTSSVSAQSKKYNKRKAEARDTTRKRQRREQEVMKGRGHERQRT